MIPSESELLKLKNLGLATVNILHAIGISTREDLATTGAVQAYCRIKARGINASKVMLYALEGALLDVHWNDLTPEHKRELVDASESQSETVAPDV